MKRLILEMGSGSDLYGRDYTKAALRALNNALRHSSITLFSALDISHEEMQVVVTIGVQEPDAIDVARILAEVPRGNPEVRVVFGGQNITSNHNGDVSVVANCAIEAYIPDLSEAYHINPASE